MRLTHHKRSSYGQRYLARCSCLGKTTVSDGDPAFRHQGIRNTKNFSPIGTRCSLCKRITLFFEETAPSERHATPRPLFFRPPKNNTAPRSIEINAPHPPSPYGWGNRTRRFSPCRDKRRYARRTFRSAARGERAWGWRPSAGTGTVVLGRWAPSARQGTSGRVLLDTTAEFSKRHICHVEKRCRAG